MDFGSSLPFRAPVSATDPTYREWAAREAAFWSGLHSASMDKPNRPRHALIDGHTNLRFTGDARMRWYEVIPSYGEFREGLVLGTSSMTDEETILTQNPSLHLTFLDLSRDALERRRSAFGARAHYVQADLNFLQLRGQSTDIILSSSTLHHIVNLEQLADQCWQALRPGGYLFLQDCTVESGFRFSDAKIRLFEQLHARSEHRAGWNPHRSLVWEGGPKSPFCGIRSGDLIEILTRRFEIVRLAGTGALISLLLFTRVQPSATGTRPLLPRRLWQRRKALQKLLEIDDLVCDAGLLVPYNTFAILRRTAALK
jgi:SAM-dependent methyltransferase